MVGLAAAWLALCLAFVALHLYGCGGGGGGNLTNISLDATVVPLDPSQPDGLTVARLIVTTHPIVDAGQEAVQPQKHILDTGSSTLAYCDQSISQRITSKGLDAIVCNLYGGGSHGFWGQVYRGDVSVESRITLPSSYYAVMQDSVFMCDDGNDGIFGIAFKELNEGFKGSMPPQGWTPSAVGSCPGPGEREVVDMGNPLIEKIRGSVPEQLGIYWSGQPGEGQGGLYLDRAATDNEHFKANSVLGPARLGEYGWYDVFMIAFSVNDLDFPSPHLCDCDSVETCRGKCIMDTGTPWIIIPQIVYDAYILAKSGSLGITFRGKSGDVSVHMDIAELQRNRWVQPSEDDSAIMGLPMKAFYYTLYDLQASTMSFVPNDAMWRTLNTSWDRPSRQNVSTESTVVI